MARIEGVDLPRNKRVEIGLTYIYGIKLLLKIFLKIQGLILIQELKI
ncbi:MAG: hypothetical protein AWL62_1968 [Halanaerobium sp. T82-1]|nr:MAG: hypothetical protein AWL62_1968 [Halanaerobium sp. T82-1]